MTTRNPHSLTAGEIDLVQPVQCGQRSGSLLVSNTPTGATPAGRGLVGQGHDPLGAT